MVWKLSLLQKSGCSFSRSIIWTRAYNFWCTSASILGPLLFVIHINDVPVVVKHCSIRMYAEDTVLFCSGSSVPTIETKLNTELELVRSWLDENSMFLNTTKTEPSWWRRHQTPSRAGYGHCATPTHVLTRRRAAMVPHPWLKGRSGSSPISPSWRRSLTTVLSPSRV